MSDIIGLNGPVAKEAPLAKFLVENVYFGIEPPLRCNLGVKMGVKIKFNVVNVLLNSYSYQF